MGSKEVEELVHFLSSPQPEVRSQAVQIVLGLTGTEDGIKALSGYDVTSSLVRLLTVADKDVVTNSVTCLVNLSQDKAVAKELLDKNLVDKSMELICGKYCPCKSLLVKLLQNLTLLDEGVSSLLQEKDEKLKGLHVSRLVRLFSQSHDEGEDQFEDVGMVLVNVTRAEAGRKRFLDSSKGLLKPLLRQMDSPSLVRRRGVSVILLQIAWGKIKIDNTDSVKVDVKAFERHARQRYMSKMQIETGTDLSLSAETKIFSYLGLNRKDAIHSLSSKIGTFLMWLS